MICEVEMECEGSKWEALTGGATLRGIFAAHSVGLAITLDVKCDRQDCQQSGGLQFVQGSDAFHMVYNLCWESDAFYMKGIGKDASVGARFTVI